jgi:genome maintenance exonuclease 1
LRRKIFNHVFFPNQTLERVVIDGKRHYVTPTGEKYKSVTTILGEKLDKTALLEWRKKVGEDMANQISQQAANRGTAIHSICENYLLNEESYPAGSMPANIDTFKKLRPLLDKHVGKIYGIEYFLYSHELKTAGATDCIAEWDGVPSIIDFKTSRKLKKEEWIESYLLQATAYSMMCEERNNIEIPQIVILIAVDHEEPQVFVKPNSIYRKRVSEIFSG